MQTVNFAPSKTGSVTVTLDEPLLPSTIMCTGFVPSVVTARPPVKSEAVMLTVATHCSKLNGSMFRLDRTLV